MQKALVTHCHQYQRSGKKKTQQKNQTQQFLLVIITAGLCFFQSEMMVHKMPTDLEVWLPLQEVREEIRHCSHSSAYSHHVATCLLCVSLPIPALHLLTAGWLKMQTQSHHLHQTRIQAIPILPFIFMLQYLQ